MKTTTIEPYSTIYQKLTQIAPGLIDRLAQGCTRGTSELHQPGMMDVHLDSVDTDPLGRHIITLSYSFEQHGERINDPQIQIRITPDLQIAEALAYQDHYSFEDVYQQQDGKEYFHPLVKKDLNRFLDQWLTDIIAQGHRIEFAETRAKEMPELPTPPTEEKEIPAPRPREYSRNIAR